MPDTRKRVLLFAEAVTLAHVARPLAFARGLPAERYAVAVASDRLGVQHIEAAGLERLELSTIAPADFVRALAQGKPLYDTRTLQRYVEDDLRVIDKFRPDLIIGDFRLSLSVSARLAKIPYATIASAYWSPLYTPPTWPVPALPFTRLLPLPIAQLIFRFARPLAFKLHCGPLNAVRRHFGLPVLERDLRLIYTDAEYVLYSDLPSMFKLVSQPGTHRFLGPALWEPAATLPVWWGNVPDNRPIIYVTLGSSGDAALLPTIVEEFAQLPVTLLVAAAGTSAGLPLLPNVFVAPYLPGLQAAQRASLVVCNGGSLTAYQALAAGVPVLGIAGNLDQFFNMQGIVASGAGILLRADRLSRHDLIAGAAELLRDGTARATARHLAQEIEATSYEARAGDFAADALGSAGDRASAH